MAYVTPEEIVKRHERFPEATVDLINYYTKLEVKRHVEHLLKYSSVNTIPVNNNVVIVSEMSVWRRFRDVDLFEGLSINVIEKALKP